MVSDLETTPRPRPTVRDDDALSRFDALLGEPMRDSGPFAYRTAVALDEAEQRPTEQYEKLNSWGLAEHYVPEAYGGQLSSLERLSLLQCALARRNLSVAIGHGISFLGGVHVWAYGTQQQRRRLGQTIRSGGLVALAYHEKQHGSDYLASDTTLGCTREGLRLTGEKWLVNAATESLAMTLFANWQDRRERAGGAILLLFKEELPSRSFSHLPRSKPLGVRGVDFSGIAFRDCPLPSGSIVGNEGGGLSQTLGAFQVTRALIPSLSVGALQAGIELVLAFATDRTLYRSSMTSLPYVRSQLASAFGDLAAMEALQRVVVRSAHILPESLRLWSAVSKFVVPLVVEDALRTLGELLGARAYLREEHAHGMFQKVVRDHSVIRIFHGGAFQLLQTVGLMRGRAEAAVSEDELRSIFALGADLPAFDWSRLSPSTSTYAEPAALLERRLGKSGGQAHADASEEALEALASETVSIAQRLSAMRSSQKSTAPGGGLTRGFYERTNQQCWLQAAAIVALAALDLRNVSGAPRAALMLGLERLLTRAWPARAADPGVAREEHVFEELMALHRHDRPLSLDGSVKHEGS